MIQKIESDEVKTIYGNISDDLGYYRHRPGMPPYICLDSSLLEGSEEAHQTVYNVLLEHHRSIPINSIFRSFIMVKYYKDLTPLTEPLEPELVIFGRAMVRRTFIFYEFTRTVSEPHIIG